MVLTRYLRGVLAAALFVTPALSFADIIVSDPYARASRPNAPTGAAFMVIENDGTSADRLVGVRSDIAKRVELHTHIDQDIRLEQLADVACLSTYHFSHMFKQSTGLSPYQFLLRQRMTLATTELRHATPITLVAEHCGYSNASRFARAFKGAFGVTPKAYQQA